MNGTVLPSNQSPLWRGLGWVLGGGVLGATILLSLRGPAKVTVQEGKGEGLVAGMKGSYGTITEMLGTGRFDLRYTHIEGRDEDLRLQEVVGQLAEPDLAWTLRTPKAQRAREGVWSLDGPVAIEAKDPSGLRVGEGLLQGAGPALRWERGVWYGLAPMEWDSQEGQGKGHWSFPAGWRRDELGRLDASAGPVRWTAPPGGTLLGMEARSLHLETGFQEGRMNGATAHFTDGTVWAAAADFTKVLLRWSAPMRFERKDGWRGEAGGGTAPRPAPGKGIDTLEFKTFRAHREGPGGPERLEAEGTRWTSAGLRLEGDVTWEQPLDGQRLRLRAPRVLLREGPGTDLPADLPLGMGRAEGQPVLTWGLRSLSSPRMDVDRLKRTWTLQAPVQGRSEEGTFVAGPGSGSPRTWSFEGPVWISLTNGGQIRGTRLRWEGSEWTLTGRPATWTRLGERMSGRRLVRRGEVLVFPEGLSAALASADGDLTIQADRGESEPTRVLVEGQVECRGKGWTLQADRIEATLAAGRVVRALRASGRVTLRGQVGEGRGESLELLLDKGARKATWTGRVHGAADVKPW